MGDRLSATQVVRLMQRSARQLEDVQAACLLVALSGHIEVRSRMSALGGEADVM
jgi:hypothetical protein